MIAFILGLLLTILGTGNADASTVVIPPKPNYAPTNSQWDAMEWAEFEADAYWEYSDQFTALFNSYEVKFASNGRTMIRQGDSGSFKFARKA